MFSSLQLDVSFLRDFSTVNVVANGVGNVWAHTLEIIEGDLVDEMGITPSTFIYHNPKHVYL
jgi:hypothetical protein